MEAFQTSFWKILWDQTQSGDLALWQSAVFDLFDVVRVMSFLSCIFMNSEMGCKWLRWLLKMCQWNILYHLILFLMFPKKGLTIWVRVVVSFMFYISGSLILQVRSAVCLIEKSSISSNSVEERPFWSKQRCGDLSICCDCRWCIECQSEYPLSTRHLSFPAGCLFRAESVPNILPKSYRKKGKKNNAALQTFLPVVV